MGSHRLWAAFVRRVTFLGILICLMQGPLLSAQQPGEGSDTARVDAALKQLIAEARELDSLTELQHPAVFTRPHRVVRALKTQDGPEVARRMIGRLTGDIYSDTYIRWHLMPTVRDWLRERMIQAQGGSVPELSNGVGRGFRSLFEDMPPEAESRWQNPSTEEGRKIGAQLAKLYAKTRIKVGVPPFEKTYSGRAALPHMTPRARREAEPLVEQIEALKAKQKRMKDPAVERRNERYKEMSKVLREYRCDLTYTLLQTGDNRALSELGSAIGRLIRQRQRAGFDLMQYTYIAMHDGYLALYGDRDLKAFRAKLRKVAASAKGYERYHRGEKPLPAHIQPKMRSFGQYAMHMVGLLDEPGNVRQFAPDRMDAGSDSAPAPRKPDGSFDAENLAIEDIRAAILAAVDELYTARRQGDHADAVLPHEDIHHDSEYWYLGLYKKNTPLYQEVVYEHGNHALVCWALLASGQSYQDPRLHRRISWVLASDSPYTYDRGMRLMMLSRLSLDRWGPLAKRDAAWLTLAITDRGNFNEAYFGGASEGLGDHGSGLYGVLGLWGAQTMGVDLPSKKTWAPIDQHWRTTQEQTPGDRAAGWTIGMLDAPGKGARGTQLKADPRRTRTGSFYTKANGPMTAGGVATLTLTERALNGPRLTEPGRDNVSRELRKGLRWLDENFDPAQSRGSDWFYYMWTTQRVGQATGRRTFNGVDWFRHVTAEMLNRQRPDGLWQDTTGNQGKLLSTGFALLYLANALDPIAVSKIRFDGPWDNRPNDLWNFVDYASDKYEVDTAWQIVGLNQPVYQLTQSPILYLATHKPFTLTDGEVDRLREYIHAGGMLVFNPEASWPKLSASVDELVEALFPGRALQPVAEDHPFYSLHTQLRPAVQMRMVHNGVRPLIVAFNKDIGRGLQVNDPDKRPDSFVAMSNLYLFAVSLEPHRVRLQTHYVAPPKRWPSEKLSVARIHYAGAFDPEPGAVTQLRAVFARDHGIDLAVETVGPAELAGHQFALLTTTGEGGLSDEQALAIRDWVESGGTLWLDAAGGSPKAVQSAHAMLLKLFPDRTAVPLADDSPIITGVGLGPDAHDARRVGFSRFAKRQMGPVHTPRLQAVLIDGRPAVIYSPEDLTAALAGVGHWQVFGYDSESARKLLANGILAVAR